MKPVMVSDATYGRLKGLRFCLSLLFVFCIHKTVHGTAWAPTCKRQGGDWQMTKCQMPDGSSWTKPWNEWP